MKVVHFNIGTGNGGFIATQRVHEGLLELGVDSVMVVRDNLHDEKDVYALNTTLWSRLRVKVRGALSRVLHNVLLGRGALNSFSLQWLSTGLPKRVKKELEPDILHVHCASDGLWSLQEMARWEGPIVWTFHDIRPFSQGYYALGEWLDAWIEGGRVGCFHDRDTRLFAGLNLSRKKALFSKRNDVCISPSKYVHEAEKVSGVFNASKHVHIPNGICIERYQGAESQREAWRTKYGVKEDEFLILAGAANVENRVKGFDLLLEALSKAAELSGARLKLALFGAGKVPESFQSLEVIALGYLNEQEIIDALVSADVMAIPSREDNFPNVILEALAVGLPYVGFNVGGVGEMVENEPECGRIVEAFDADAYAKAIVELASETAEQKAQRRMRCKEVVARVCDHRKIAQDYLDVYRSLGTGLSPLR